MRWWIGGLVVLALPYGVLQLLERGVVWFNAPSRATYPIRGLDVSHHQGRIDWSRVAGVDFVYVKATEGGDHRDTRFAENFDGARRAGLPRGAYHFFTFCRSGRVQADNFAAVVPTDAELPMAVDLEFGGNCTRRPSWVELRNELTTFVDTIEARYGEPPVLYVTEELLALYPVDTLGLPIWIRSVYTEPKRTWSLWQYHCRARVDGIEGPVDLNVATETWWTAQLRPRARTAS
ncbi:MAG: GH25 family lysozyme [Deltaproteobacteria bacterium]